MLEGTITGLDTAYSAQDDDDVFAVSGVLAVAFPFVEAHGRHVEVLSARIFRVDAGEFPIPPLSYALTSIVSAL
ncbi:MAG: hypothetical protein H6672_15595 [Anaerolineaceae bacterium]|nr:hypothetical protein [Anaerolineaceae bacterium]